MAPELAALFYVAAILCFLAAALGVVPGVRRPIALGWLGVALVTAVLLADVVKAID